MNKAALAKELLSKKETRIALCNKSFKYFFIYYFFQDIRYPEFAPYHHERFRAVEQQLNIYAQGHRESAKTTILGFAQEIWKICYGKTRFIANRCYDATKAKEFNFIIANILASNPRIKEDFGQLYRRNQRTIGEEDFMLRNSISEFVTTSGIKVKAFGSGQAIRGEIHEHPKHGKVRPDHLNMDDLDNIKNTKNKTIIAEDMEFMKQEVFGGLDSNAQIVICGNVIRKDGRNVRIFNMFKGDKRWACFDNFIYGKAGTESGTPIWSRFVNSDAEAQKKNEGIEDLDAKFVSLETKKSKEASGYAQNWIGSPMTVGQTIIEIAQLQMIKKHQLPTSFDYITIGGDPAFSLNNATDAFGIVVTGHKFIGEMHLRYVLKSVKLEGAAKEQDNVDKTFVMLYNLYGASRITVENNNGGAVFARSIQKHHVAVDVVNATRDKLTRFKEYETDFRTKTIFFLEGETEQLIDQLIEFTGEDGNEDDLVDAMVRSFIAAVQKEYTN